MSEPNYYELLGVDPKARREEMWVAYRRRQEEWAGDRAKLNALKMAWSELGDTVLRKAYDKKLAKLSKLAAKEPHLGVEQGEHTMVVEKQKGPCTEILAPVVSLNVAFPEGKTKTFAITSPVTTIGRKADNYIVLPDKSRYVSRYHAEIRVKEGRYYIVDKNSKNGTALNGKLLPPSEERELRDGDQINIEGRVLKFRLGL